MQYYLKKSFTEFLRKIQLIGQYDALINIFLSDVC